MAPDHEMAVRGAISTALVRSAQAGKGVPPGCGTSGRALDAVLANPADVAALV